MLRSDSSNVRVSIALVVMLLAALVARPGFAANVQITFSGAINSVTSASTSGAETPESTNVVGSVFVGTEVLAPYSGSIVYDDATGAITSGTLTFDNNYGFNNYFSPLAPPLAWTQWKWGPVTYGLTGNIQTSGNSASLLIGNLLDPTVHVASSPEVLAVGSASLAPAIAGAPPVCTAFDPDRQVINCSFAPGIEVLGLDSLFIDFDLAGGSHSLGMDEVIEHCEGGCSTEWHHMMGGGSASMVPVPAAVWLFGSAIGALGWLRRRPVTG